MRKPSAREIFARRMKTLLEPRGKATEVHEKTGIDPATISGWKNGTNDNPTLDSLERLSGALDVSVCNLISLTESREDVIKRVQGAVANALSDEGAPSKKAP